MSATTAAAAAAVSVMIASTCRLIPIAIVAVARAALVMMVMVALLLALQAHVRDDHLRVVAHAVVIAAASAKEYNYINQFAVSPYRSFSLTCPDSHGSAACCRADCRGSASCWADPASPCGAERCASCSSRRIHADSPMPGGSICKRQGNELLSVIQFPMSEPRHKPIESIART